MNKIEEIRNYLNTLAPEQIDARNRKQEAENKKMFLEFSYRFVPLVLTKPFFDLSLNIKTPNHLQIIFLTSVVHQK